MTDLVEAEVAAARAARAEAEQQRGGRVEQDDDEEDDELETLIGDKGSQDALDAALGRKRGGVCRAGGRAFMWVGAVLIALFTMGTSLAYDSVGALGPLFKTTFNTDAAGLANLYSAYHLPNVFFVFFGGLLADRIGVRRASLLFSMIVCLGTVVVASSTTMGGVLAGRFIFGLGSETLGVVQLSMLQRWFARSRRMPTLGVACAVSLTANRMGTLAAFDVLPLVAEPDHLSRGLWLVVAVAVACFLVTIVLLVMDRSLPASVATVPHQARVGSPSPGAMARVRDLQPAFWYLVMVSLSHYSALISFSDFSADFFNESFGYTAAEAARIQSVVTLVGLIGSPLGGYVADRYGGRLHMMIGGSLLLLPAHLFVTFWPQPPAYSVLLQGVATVLVACTLWPSLALVVPSHSSNAAVGLQAALQNAALLLYPQVVGELRVHEGSYAVAMRALFVPDLIAIFAVWRLFGCRDPRYGVGILALSADEIHALIDKKDVDDAAADAEASAEEFRAENGTSEHVPERRTLKSTLEDDDFVAGEDSL